MPGGWFSAVIDHDTAPSLGQAPANQWIVQLTSDAAALAGDARGAAALLKTGASEIQVLRGLGLPGLVLVAAQLPQAQVESLLGASPLVQSFELNRAVGASLLPSDPEFVAGSQHSLENNGAFGTADADIDAAAAWDLTTGDPSVVVGVIDSGAALDHPDLYLNIWIHQGEIPPALRGSLVDVDTDSIITFRDLNQPANAAHVTDFNTNGYIDAYDLLGDVRWADAIDNEGNGFVDDLFGWDFIGGGAAPQTGGDNDPSDEHGHGTHVAGTIAAMGDNGIGVTGITWKTSIMPLRFLDANRSGQLADAIAAINYATMMHSQFGVNMPITNNSWGYRGEESELLRLALEANAAADMLLVAAAGNGDALGLGIDNDADPQFAFYPATSSLGNVVSVAATDSRDRLARFSNFGAATVDIAAPGVGIVSTDPLAQGNGGYAIRSGTSMAAPLVSGVAALVWALNPTATAAEVKAALLDAAALDPLTDLTGRIVTGGRLNALGALSVDRIAPRAHLTQLPNVDGPGVSQLTFSIAYTDNRGLNAATISGDELTVTDTFDGSVLSGITLINSVASDGGKRIDATYRLTAPSGAFDEGDYEVALRAGEVFDMQANSAAHTVLGRFNVDTTPNLIRAGDFTDSLSVASLRGAIVQANASPEAHTIRLTSGTYRLSIGGVGEDAAAVGDLDLSGTLTIKGAGADKTIIDAAVLDRVFQVMPGAVIELRDLSITGGFENSNGGGILVANGGSLVLRRVMISDSEATNGGGIFNAGTLEVYQSTLYENRAFNGGALYNAAGASALLEGTTLSTNLASKGAGVFNSGSLAVRSSTVTANLTLNDGGGIWNNSGSVTLVNSIVAGTQGIGSPQDVFGSFNSLGFNLIGSTSSSGWVASDMLNVDPQLGPLQRNGGNVETAPVWTHAPLPGSPAIDAGNNSAAPAIDQRGLPRPLDANGDSIATVDIGAVERYFGSIAGIRFLDQNENGLRDAGEIPLAGLAVYVDLNQNDRFDSGEPLALTQADGSYQFTGLAPGNYSVVDLPQQGWRQIRFDYGTALQLASVGTDILQTNSHSSEPAISANGRFVAFTSSASNLAAGDTNFARDVFLYDREAETLQMISVTAAGLPGNGDSYNPSISADGNIVVFESVASNIDPLGLDTNGVSDIYAYNRATGSVSLVSRGNGASANPQITADGRFVAFDSLATDLVAADTNQSRDVFLHDLQTGVVERVSLTSAGTQANFHSSHPALSGDGRIVVFESQAQNLDDTGLDIDSSNDIYARDMSTGTTELISVGGGGTAEADNPSSNPVVSSDGRYVAFRSFATNLVPNDNNNASDVFVFDRVARSMQAVSVTAGGMLIGGSSEAPTINADGRYVAFRSQAPLVAGDTNGVADVFLYDRTSSTITRANINVSGSEANGHSSAPAISADGSYLAWVSQASNQVSGDSNDRDDIFLLDRTTQTVARVNTTTVSAFANGPSAGSSVSEASALSADGRFVVFSSSASNLVSGDTNGQADVFVRDRLTGAIELISRGLGGTPANGESRNPALSADGRFVAFESVAANLVADDLNGQADVFVYDRLLKSMQIVSLAAGGTQSNGASLRPAISANGNLIAFESRATNLDPLGIDTESDLDIYTFDRTSGTVELITFGASGSGANGDSHSARLSADGNSVVFASTATNLAAGSVDLNGVADVYLYDRVNRATTLISAGLGGSVAIGTVLYSADMTADPGWTLDGPAGAWEYGVPQGMFDDPSSGFTGPNVVGFNLAGPYLPGTPRSYATTGPIDVTGHDSLVLQFQRHLAVEPPMFSRAGIEVSADGGAWLPVWENSSFVADFAWQRVTYPLPVEQATTIRIRWYLESTPDAFELGGWNLDDVIVGSAVTTPAAAAGTSHSPAISADGRFVAYVSDAGNLISPDPTASRADVYVFDRQTGMLQWIAPTADSGQSSFGEGVSLSGDGRYVAFASGASNLVAGDTNHLQDIFVYDGLTGGMELLSKTTAVQSNQASGRPVLSADGRYVSFRSEADNFVPGDLNFAADVFIAPTSALARQGIPVTIAAGTVVEGIDLGNKPGPGTIRGRLFQDENQDGVRQANESALNGWTVYIDANQNGTLDTGEAFRVTNSFGEYEFAELVPLQTYRLRSVAQSFWVQTMPRLTEGGVQEVVLAAGALEDNRDFGYHFRGPDGQSLNEISGVYFLDANRNGIRDAGESPIAGGVVYIDANGNAVLDADESSQTTDAGGNYHFTGLPVGSYVIRIVGDPQFVRTQPLNNALPGQLIAGSLETTQGLAIGDFNGDSFDDLAVASGDGILVQLNDQAGGFLAPIRTTAGVGAAGAFTVVAARFNSDAFVDLAFTNRLTNNVTVMFGNGGGTFTHSANYTVGTWPHGLTAGDFNRDGRIDLAVGTEAFGSTRGTVQILWNNASGDGTFNVPQAIHSAATTNVFFLQAIQLTDDNLDGLVNASDAVDLAVVNFDRLGAGNAVLPGNVTLLYNGSAGFTTSIELPAARGPAAVAAGDFDADGDLDLAVANFASDSVSVYRNVGNGSMIKLPGEIAAGSGPFAVTSADVDGDGDLDLVVSGSAGSRLLVLRNVTAANGDATFSPAETYGSGAFPRAVSSSVGTADFDRDGLPDMVIAYNDNGSQIENRSGNVEVYYNAVFPGGYEVLLNGLSPAPRLEFGVAAAAASSVVGRHLFYNHSMWDGQNPTASAADDAAIATDKAPLLPGGGPAAFANYSSYSRGINGVMIDIADLPTGVTLDPAVDFAFRIGNDDNPAGWQALSQLPTVSIRRGAGNGGSARVTLLWPDQTIMGTWLEITVRATSRTGLSAADVFYFGSAPGETGNAEGTAAVNANDFAEIRANPKLLLSQADIRNPHDVNRDGLVNADDTLVVRQHASGLGSTLRLISLGSSFSGGGEGENANPAKGEAKAMFVGEPARQKIPKQNVPLPRYDDEPADALAAEALLDCLMASLASDEAPICAFEIDLHERSEVFCDPLESAVDALCGAPDATPAAVLESDLATI